MQTNTLIHGDCLEKLKELTDNSVDAIITDPPYGLKFMGKKWDCDVPSVEIWQECLRVLKPGGYLLAFAGTRTQHRIATRIEDAGFEIRDMIAWVYGSGFPKNTNIGKKVDKLQGNEREITGEKEMKDFSHHRGSILSKETTPDGKTQKTTITVTTGYSKWEGWSSALKPALEPITMARKPLSEPTLAKNCLKWGTGAINIDACRIPFAENEPDKRVGTDAIWNGNETREANKHTFSIIPKKGIAMYKQGRYPANLIHDGSEDVLALFPKNIGQEGKIKFTGKRKSVGSGRVFGKGNQTRHSPENYGDSGSAGRFFYTAKASKSERNAGLESLQDKVSELNSGGIGRKTSVDKRLNDNESNAPTTKNHHPTVKPVSLMEYLVKLVTREGALVLDPLAGSGTTGIACKNLRRNYILIEKEAEYIEIISKRVGNHQPPPIQNEIDF